MGLAEAFRRGVRPGEGGALTLRDESLLERAEYIREKGTNRRRFQSFIGVTITPKPSSCGCSTVERLLAFGLLLLARRRRSRGDWRAAGRKC